MRQRSLAIVLVLVASGAASPAWGGQDAGTSRPAPQPPRPTPDFLFGQPRGSLGVRGSWVFARAGSDIFDFVREHLTVDNGAFDAPAIATDLAIAVAPRVDAVFGFEFSQASVASEYRKFVDNNRQPIEQTTRLREVNLSGTVRVARRLFVTLEGRYLWATATLQRQFENFDPIDLAGFRTSAGINVLF